MFPVCHKHITASPRLRNGHLLAILPNGQDARPPLRSCFGPMASDLDGVVRSCRRPRCRAACPGRAGQPGIRVATRFPRHRPLHPSPPSPSADGGAEEGGGGPRVPPPHGAEGSRRWGTRGTHISPGLRESKLPRSVCVAGDLGPDHPPPSPSADGGAQAVKHRWGKSSILSCLSAGVTETALELPGSVKTEGVGWGSRSACIWEALGARIPHACAGIDSNEGALGRHRRSPCVWEVFHLFLSERRRH